MPSDAVEGVLDDVPRVRGTVGTSARESRTASGGGTAAKDEARRETCRRAGTSQGFVFSQRLGMMRTTQRATSSDTPPKSRTWQHRLLPPSQSRCPGVLGRAAASDVTVARPELSVPRLFYCTPSDLTYTEFIHVHP